MKRFIPDISDIKYIIMLVVTLTLIAFVARNLFASQPPESVQKDMERARVEATTHDSKADAEAANLSSSASAKSKKTDTTVKDEYLPAIPSKWTSEVKTPIRHKAYTLLYDTKHNNPAWVAWKLTKAHTYGNVPRSQKFWADTKIPLQYRVEFYDYRESKGSKDMLYDRGHMCPAGDNKWDETAMYECFYMSNMCPQNRTLNSGSWAKLENACRSWARTEGAIYIVCGPIYDRERPISIGVSHKVDVPDGFFKAVLSLRKGHEKAIAFYFDNDASDQNYRKLAVPVDNIEDIAGFDLFANLDKQLQKRVEAKADINEWR